MAPLSIEATERFESIIRHDKISKNTALLEIGKRAKSMLFLKTGLACAYYYHDGKDVTDYFATDGQFIGAVPSLFNRLPSLKGIHLIEDSDVFHFLSIDFEVLCSQFYDFEHIARMMLAYALLEEQERIESLRFYSVRERYQLMKKNIRA